MSKKSNIGICILVVVFIFTIAMIAKSSWENYTKELEVKLQVNLSKQNRLEHEIRMLQADNQAKDKQINELESKPQ